jgi:hypothetical protein
MATNPYFSQGVRNEQLLYEDLIIESLKMYGQDVYYIPREIVNEDTIFKDDVPSQFENAYKIESYIENIEGFDGEGDLFTKFGVEIRDAATFIIARRRWNYVVKRMEQIEGKPFYRPREGDLIYLTLSGSIFEITKVQDESPFYQLKNLPVFRMTCELFEYSGEQFETGVDEIDDVEGTHAYQTIFTLDSSSTDFLVGENITQAADGYTMNGEIVKIDAYDPNSVKLYVSHVGSTDSDFHSFSLTSTITGATSGAVASISSLGEDLQEGAQNSAFDLETINFIDFSESNPFGDPL